AAPLALGLAVAPALYPRFAPDGVGYWPFALFVAAAISVTAFPVLARILRDRGLARSTPGRLALGAGLVHDAVVWIVRAAGRGRFGARGGRHGRGRGGPGGRRLPVAPAAVRTAAAPGGGRRRAVVFGPGAGAAGPAGLRGVLGMDRAARHLRRLRVRRLPAA